MTEPSKPASTADQPAPRVTRDSPMTDLPVKTHQARRVLRTMTSIDELLRHTFAEVLRMPGCGRSTLADIEQTLAEYG